MPLGPIPMHRSLAWPFVTHLFNEPIYIYVFKYMAFCKLSNNCFGIQYASHDDIWWWFEFCAPMRNTACRWQQDLHYIYIYKHIWLNPPHFKSIGGHELAPTLRCQESREMTLDVVHTLGLFFGRRFRITLAKNAQKNDYPVDAMYGQPDGPVVGGNLGLV